MSGLVTACFSCRKRISQYQFEYFERLEAGKKIPGGETAKEILDSLKIKRFCCRRMFLSHVDDDYLLLYPAHPGGIHRMAGPKTETPYVNRFAQNQGYTGDDSSDDESENSDSGDEIYSEELVSADDEDSSSSDPSADDESSSD